MGGRPSGVLIKRSFALAGHRTSVALEEAFWAALGRIAESRTVSLGALVADIDATRDPARSLASALRLLALHEAERKGAAVNRYETG